MQPRIYTYKITFEEVPYYYYGSKKEKRYDEYYMGSPKANKWCWEFYTPKKQILEVFDYSDEGYEECRKVEDRLIRPVLNDPYCLNEACGGVYSLDISRKSGNKVKELGIGLFSIGKEERIEIGKKSGNKAKELSLGIHGMSMEERSELGKKNGKKNYELGLGIFSLTEEEKSEVGRKGGNKSKKLGVGICGLTLEQRKKNGAEYGKRGGARARELGVGICGLTTEQRRENAKKLNSQKWQCTETGYISTKGGLSTYQNNRGIDTSKRIRIK